MPEHEGQRPGGGGGGPTFVPISNTPPVSAGTSTQGGIQYNMYATQVSSTDGTAHSIGVSVPSGCLVNPSSPLPIQASPDNPTQLTVYVPTTNTGRVDATCSQTGYTDYVITMQGG